MSDPDELMHAALEGDPAAQAAVHADPILSGRWIEELTMHAALVGHCGDAQGFARATVARLVRRGESRSFGNTIRQRLRQQRRRKKLALTCAGALALAATLLGFIHLATTSAPPVELIGSDAVVTRNGTVLPKPTEGRQPLQAGDRIHAQAGVVELRWQGEATSLRMLQGCIVRLEPGPGKRLHLLQGAAEASIAPQPAELPLLLASAHAEFVVLGTRFRCDATPGRSLLTVEEGRVRINAAKGSQEIGAGQGAEANAAGRITPLSADRRPVAHWDWADSGEVARRDRVGGLLARAQGTVQFSSGSVRMDGTGMLAFALPQHSKRWTFCLWVRHDETDSSQCLLSTSAGGFHTPGMRWFLNSWGTADGHWCLETAHNGKARKQGSQTRLLLDRGWHHMALVVDRTAAWAELYCDGQLVPCTGSIVQDVPIGSGRPIYLGAFGTSQWGRLRGSVADLRCFALCLTPAEIAALAHQPP